MNVEIINVGTELLLGEIVNSNATLLLKTCKDLGFDVYFQTVVGDNQERFLKCLEIAFQRGTNCVITTGGLGPTTDDLTKELSAEFLGLEMVYHEDEARKVEKKCQYCTGVQDISKNNFKQAYFPKDAYILENNMGTANACVMNKNEKMIINLPGPPKELQYVVEHSLLSYLSQYKTDTIYTYEYLTMFIGESQIDEMLCDLIDHQKDVSIALYAGEETVRIRLAVKTKSQKEADEKMERIKIEIEKRLQSFIIFDKDIKKALFNCMVPISIEYYGRFRLKTDFLNPYLSLTPKIKIIVETKREAFGEVIVFHLNHESFEVPTFVNADDSYAKVEARFIIKLYQYIKKINLSVGERME